MLKIIDNVDLKELEKFGFRKWEDNYIKDITSSITCFVSIDYREIWFSCSGVIGSLEILFDLIQAGLVEKVEN